MVVVVVVVVVVGSVVVVGASYYPDSSGSLTLASSVFSGASVFSVFRLKRLLPIRKYVKEPGELP